MSSDNDNPGGRREVSSADYITDHSVWERCDLDTTVESVSWMGYIAVEEGELSSEGRLRVRGRTQNNERRPTTRSV